MTFDTLSTVCGFCSVKYSYEEHLKIVLIELIKKLATDDYYAKIVVFLQ